MHTHISLMFPNIRVQCIVATQSLHGAFHNGPLSESKKREKNKQTNKKNNPREEFPSWCSRNESD